MIDLKNLTDTEIMALKNQCDDELTERSLSLENILMSSDIERMKIFIEYNDLNKFKQLNIVLKEINKKLLSDFDNSKLFIEYMLLEGLPKNTQVSESLRDNYSQKYLTLAFRYLFVKEKLDRNVIDLLSRLKNNYVDNVVESRLREFKKLVEVSTINPLIFSHLVKKYQNIGDAFSLSWLTVSLEKEDINNIKLIFRTKYFNNLIKDSKNFEVFILYWIGQQKDKERQINFLLALDECISNKQILRTVYNLICSVDSMSNGGMIYRNFYHKVSLNPDLLNTIKLRTNKYTNLMQKMIVLMVESSNSNYYQRIWRKYLIENSEEVLMDFKKAGQVIDGKSEIINGILCEVEKEMIMNSMSKTITKERVKLKI